MKKLSQLFLAATCISVLSFVGCGGGGENTIVEAPPVEEEAAMPGMSEEDYTAAMDAEMSGQ